MIFGQQLSITDPPKTKASSAGSSSAGSSDRRSSSTGPNDPRSALIFGQRLRMTEAPCRGLRSGGVFLTVLWLELTKKPKAVVLPISF